jgi:hypothetical protein
VVGGLELDFSYSNIRGSSAPAVLVVPRAGITDTSILGDDVKWLGSSRGRLGITPGDNCGLFYGTAGLAWERVDRLSTIMRVGGLGPGTQFSTTPTDRFGWVAGVGAEAKLGGSNWIGRIEYLHYDFGTVQATTTSVVTPGPGSFSDSAGRQTIDMVCAALSYKL